MHRLLALVGCVLVLGLAAADEPAKTKIIPGKAIVPTDKMRRPWGELVSLDLKTRTGTFRSEGNDEVMSFTVLPFAELLHHATFGDLQDFRPGERAIFRLHEDADGKWVLLTYIQDEINFLNGHKEYYWVDKIDADKGRIEFTDANADRSYTREKGLFLDTDKETRYWKDGKSAKFADIQVGDKLRAKTHGVGKGRVRVAWEVFLDDASLLKFQEEQKAVHAKRMKEEGLPGYVDEVDGKQVKLTLFQEAREACKGLKSGQKVKVAAVGANRKPGAAAVDGTLKEIKPAGALHLVTVVLDEAAGEGVKPMAVARVWVWEP